MDARVEKEINTLKQMVCNWYNFYLNQANGHKYDCVHLEEFDDVVYQQLSPYLQRLAKCNYLDKDELGDIYLYLATKRQDLELEIAAVKPEEKEDPIVTLLRELDLTEGQLKAVVEYCRIK